MGRWTAVDKQTIRYEPEGEVDIVDPETDVYCVTCREAVSSRWKYVLAVKAFSHIFSHHRDMMVERDPNDYLCIVNGIVSICDPNRVRMEGVGGDD